MSTTIDERVVEMRFDNKHFENNVSTTMSTLDKLKQKLNLSGASKGLENVSAAARKVDLSPVNRSAETVGLKFNAMYTIADQALRNITNSAMMYGKRIISALTIDPVKTGFSEYELKMNSVQTIMASTGETIDTVNEYLQELNEYSDKTIYSFSDMTQNIGKFTNAGVKLEDAVAAIKGISNEAAVSGANANEASRAMYNFAQALSAGYVKLIDWKSIENANMATVEFKNELIKTAVELKTVTDLGDGMYETLSGKSFNATKNFNDVLQEQWMTSDVLITTLKKYADTNEDIGIKATEAATKVKTFTQLWDTLKESAQSGWATSWEILVGDLEEAKELLTGISKFVGGIIDATSDWRNILLDGVFGDTFGRIKDILDKSGLGTLDKYTDKVSNLTDLLEYYQKVVDKVWRGDYNNRGDDPDRFDLLTGEGYDPRIVQNLVNLGKDHTLTVEELEAAYAKWGKTAEGTSEATESIASNLENLSDEQLRSMGLTEVEIELLRHLERIAKMTGKSLSEVLEERANLSGRQMLIDSFKGIVRVLGEVADAVKVAWEAVFNPSGLSSEEKMSNRIMILYNALTKFYDIASNLTLAEGSAEKLTRTFKGLFAILDIVSTLLGGGFKIAFKIVGEILKYFNLDILDVTAGIGDALVGFQQWLNSLFDVHKVLAIVVPAIRDAAKWVEELCAEIAATDEFKEFREHLTEAGTAFEKLADGFTKTGILKKFASALGSVITAIAECIVALANSSAVHTFVKFITSGLKSITDWIEGIKSIDGSELTKHIVKGIVIGVLSIGNAIWNLVVGLGGYIVEGLSAGISSGADGIFATILKIGGYIVEAIKDYFGIHSPSTLMIAIGGFIISGLVVGLQDGLGGVWTVIKNLCSGVMDTITGLVDSAKQLDAGTLIAAAITGGIVVAVWKVADAVRTLASPLEDLGDMFEGVGRMCKQFGKGVRNYFNAKAVQSLVISLAILVGAIVVMGYAMSDPKVAQGIKDSFWILAGLAGVIALMAAAVIGLNALGAKAEGGEAALKNIMVPLLTIAGTMLILAGVLKLISSVGNTEGALKTMLAMAVGILAFASVMGLIGRNGLFDGVEKAGVMLLGISAAMLLMIGVVKLAGKMNKGEITRGLVLVTAIGLLFAAIIRICKTGNTYYAEPSGLLKMSIAMGIMVLVVKLAAKLDKGEVTRGMGFVAAVGLLFLAVVAVSKIAGEHASGAGGMLLKMALAMLTMVWIVKLAAGMSETDLKKALPAITLVGIIFAALISVSTFAGKNADKAGSMLIKMSAALLILTGVIFILGLFKPEILAKGLVAISLLSLCFMGLVKATTGLRATKSMVSTLLMLTIVIGVMGALVIGLSFIDPKRVAVASGAIAGIVGIFAALILAMQTLSGVKISVGPLVAVLAMTVILGAVVLALSLIPNTDNALKNAAALSVLAVTLLVLSGVLAVLSLIGPKATVSYPAMLAVAALIGGLTVVLVALGALTKIPGFTEMVVNGAKLLLMFSVLSTTVLALSGIVAVLSLVGPTATMSYPAMLAVAALIGGLTVVLVALGALTKISGFTELIGDGGKVLGMIGLAIGEFVGGIVGGIGAGVAQGLPAIGESLTEFMKSASGFFDKLGSLDKDAIDGVKTLAETILILTAADIIDGLTSWLTGGSSLDSFATQLPLLAQGLAGFKTALGEGGFTAADCELVANAANAVKILASAASEIPNSGGWVGAIVGENDLDTFASKFPILGEGLAKFKESLGENSFTEDDCKIVENAANAVKTLAAAASEIPNSGGWVGAILGENDLDTFAAKFPKLGEGLVAFKEAIGSGDITFTEGDLAAVEVAANAVKKFSEAAQDIPNSGGWVAKLIGDNDLATFAEKFPAVATGLAGFKINIGSWTEDDTTMIGSVVTAITSLAHVAKKINEDTSIWDSLNDDFMDFVKKLPDVATQLKNFKTNIGESFTTDTASVFNSVASTIKILAETNIGEDAGTNLEAFAYKLPGVASNLKLFATNMFGIGAEVLSLCRTAVTSIVSTVSHILSVDTFSAYDRSKQIKATGDQLSSAVWRLADLYDTVDFAESAIDTLKGIVNGLVDLDTSGIALLADALEQLTDDAITAFSEAFSSKNTEEKIESGIKTMVENVATAVEGNSSTLETACKDLVSAGVSVIKNDANYNSFANAGYYLASGLAAGLQAGMPKVQAAATRLAKAAERAVELAEQINSPSKVFYRLGDFMAMGLTNALYDSEGDSYDAASRLAKSATNGLSDAISKIRTMIGSDMDVQPTIKPIMDLSNIKSGVGAMNNLLSIGSSNAVLANVGAINTTMNRRSQNGGMNDVVSAIDKLRGELGNVGNTNYNINGLSYSNDAELDAAFKTIVRAVKVGRRV